MNKKVYFKIYENDGTYITTLLSLNPLNPNREDVLFFSFPKIISEINKGFGQLTIKTNQRFSSFDTNILKNNNIIKIYVWDDVNNTNEILMYTGIILRIDPFFENGREGNDIIVIGRNSELFNDFYTSSGNYSFNKNLKASDIFKDIIDNFLTIYTNSEINYSVGSVEDSVTTLDLDFLNEKWISAINKVQKNAPSQWWWNIEPDGTAIFKSKPSTATHVFDLKTHVSKIKTPIDMEPVINKIILESSAPASPHIVTDATSIANYGTRSIHISDTNINDNTTALARANSELANNKDLKNSCPVTINSTYNIESIKVGDTCRFQNYDNTDLQLSENMQIVRVAYDGLSVDLSLEENYNDIAKQINKLTS